MGFIKKVILFLFFVGTIGIAGLFLWTRSIPIPDFETFDERKVIQSTKIYDKTGKNLLYDVHENIKRTVITYDEIPINIKNATVAIEDSSFYQHYGVSFTGILRAFLTNLSEGRLRGQGGSTITQQLVKNTFLTTEKTFTRKIKELVLSLKVEKAFPKEKILTLYLNEIPYGGSNYGIEAAAQSFFNKKAKDLSLAESAYLAAMPQAPSYYSPYGNHFKELKERKNTVLKRMLDLKFIEEEEYEKAKNEEVVFISRDEQGIQAPHFVMYIKSYMEEKYGADTVEQAGFKVTTTLDLELQKEAEKMVKDYAEENEKNFNAYNASMVAIDPKTGQILVMVGSRDWHGDPLPEGCTPGVNCKFEPQLNASTYGKGRQPGSSFKPFVYATAFKKGYTPDTVVFDLKTEFNASCNSDGTPKPGINQDECYHPENYDHVFRGPVSLRNALAQSVNVPAVKVLYLAGLKDSLQTAKDLGITTLTSPERYGLTLVLGGGEVTLLEMTGAYSVFANDGYKNPVTGIIKIEDSRGKIIEEYHSNPQKVLEENIVRFINDVLSDNVARSPAFGENSWLHFPDRDVAVKTGTTNDYKDAWVVGYTPNFSLGLWVGNNDNTSMEKKVAGFIAAPLWNQFLKKAFEKLPEENFIKPGEIKKDELKPIIAGYWQGGEVYKIDKVSKKLATEYTPEDMVEIKVLTQVHSILYWVNKNNPMGEKPENPENDSQFFNWEIPVRSWVTTQGIKEETNENIPKEYDDIHKPEYFPIINILNPIPGSNLNNQKQLNIKIESHSRFPLEKIDVYLDGNYLGFFPSLKNEMVFSLENIYLNEGKKELKLIVYDNMKNKKEYSVILN